MKLNKVKIIITVMAISVIGLVLIQIYWIKNVLKIEEERFERKANDALLMVAKNIDRNEAVKTISKKILTSKDGKIIVQSDSSRKILNEKLTSHTQFNLIKADSHVTPHLKYQLSIKNDKSKSEAEIHIVKTDTSMKNRIRQENFVWKTMTDSLIVKKRAFVDNVVADLIMISQQEIEDRLSKRQLDSLINSELRNRGINSEYYFGILKTFNDSLVLVKDGTSAKELKKSNLNTILFQDEFFGHPNKLFIYFPNKTSYLFTSVAGMLSLSAFIILMVIFVFYKTLQMFLKQKKLSEIKDDLINNITHEFKTPISTISIACEALQEPNLYKKIESIHKYSGIIKEENERLRMMVETFLNTVAVENGSFNITKEQINLISVINSVVNKFFEILISRQGKIELELNNEIPSINSDRFHFSNILSNLIDNAINYCDKSPLIIIKTSFDGESIKISISDNGVGISNDQLNKIFDTFYRVPTGNIHNVRGNGIGLSYCNKMVTALGGELSVTSTIGIGSTFEISFPAE